MSRKKRTSENSDSGAIPSTSDSAPEPQVVETLIETHEAAPESLSLVERAKRKLTDLGHEAIASDEPGSDKKEPRWKKYQRGKKERQDKQQADIGTLVSTILVILIALWSVPQEIKPTNDEVDQFSDHLAGIIYRHTPVGALSEDVLDLVGMAAVVGVYLTRTSEARRAIAKTRREQPELSTTRPIQYKHDGKNPGVDYEHTDERTSPTPFEIADKAVGDFMKDAKEAYDNDQDFHAA